MALIKCPECGHEISDKATKCIYCGKELFHCPECGKTTVRHGDTCPQCGYALPVAPKPAPARAPVATTASASTPVATSEQAFAPNDPNGLMNAWKKANPKVKVQSIKSRSLLGFSSMIIALLFVISMLLIAGVIPPTKGIKNGNLTSIEFFARYDECETLFNALIGVTVVLSLISPICKIFCDHIPSIRCAAWIKKMGYDLKPYVADYQNNKLRKGKWTQSDQAAYYVLSKNGKAAGIVLCVSECFDMIPTSIILAVFFKQVCLSVMIAWQLNEPAQISIPWGLLGMAFACMAVWLIMQITVIIICPRYLKKYPTKDEQ